MRYSVVAFVSGPPNIANNEIENNLSELIKYIDSSRDNTCKKVEYITNNKYKLDICLIVPPNFQNYFNDVKNNKIEIKIVRAV